MAEGMGEISNLAPQAATAARAFARPIGAVSEANWRKIEKMAEREGFEPPIPLRVCRISSAVLSTTQPPLREMLVCCCQRGALDNR